MSEWKLWKHIQGLLKGTTQERIGQVSDEKSAPALDVETTSEPETLPQPHAETAGRQKKSISQVFAKPSLYFSGWGFDERNGSAHLWETAKRAVWIEAGGQTYALRGILRHHVFREQGDADERAALFVAYGLDRQWSWNIADVPVVEFARIVSEWKFGRILLHVADCMAAGQCVYLGFMPDGSGITLDERLMSMGAFNWQEATDQPWPELLTASPELLRPFCELLFTTQINPRSISPYIDPAILESVPHEFLTGSEEELRRLTLAIVQTEPGLFDTNLEPVTITYRAQTPNKRGGMTRIEQKNSTCSISGRMTSLCDLATRLNTFTGVEWKPRIPNPNRLSHWEKQIHRVRVVAHPPSAHERAESLLILAEWLEGKVREPKRLCFLGIEE